MRAIFRICGNESQPGLQLVEKLATPLAGLSKCILVSVVKVESAIYWTVINTVDSAIQLFKPEASFFLPLKSCLKMRHIDQ